MPSIKIFAFVMLSKAMKAKNFGAFPSRAVTFSVREIATVLKLDFHSGSVGRSAESLKAIGIGYLVNLNHNINRAWWCEHVDKNTKAPAVTREAKED
jgi:hypothetical protein